MLSNTLKGLIVKPSPIARKKYPQKDNDIEQKKRYNELIDKYAQVERCLVPPSGKRSVTAEKLYDAINQDILFRFENDTLATSEKASLNVREETFYNKKTKKNEKRRFVIPLRQVQRFAENYPSTADDINVLLIYLEVPYAEWDQYYNPPEEKTPAIFEALTPSVKLEKKHEVLARSWEAYLYNPLRKKVYRLPILLEKDSSYSFKVYCRAFNDEIYQGIAVFYGHYLVVNLLNESKGAAICLQTFINDEVLNGELILNTGGIWIQDIGKPILSVLILDRAKRNYKKDNLPPIEEKKFKISTDLSVLRVNHFIEYVSRKGEPELAPRWFKPNEIDQVELRNKTDITRVKFHRPRDNYFDLAKLFVTKQSHGEWVSFSRIYDNSDPHIESVSAFKWTFLAFSNRRVIEVKRVSKAMGRVFEGTLQFKQAHISIFFTASDSYKHFLAPLDLAETVRNYANKSQQKEAKCLALLGSSSTINDYSSYLVREVLVFTDKLKQSVVKEGQIPLEEFLKLDFLDKQYKDYLSIRDEAVYHQQRAR